MQKVDMQLFQASIRAIRIELSKIESPIPAKIYAELSAMEHVIERNIANEH